MKLRETELSVLDRNIQHIQIGKILKIEGNNVTMETTFPNLKTRTDRLPLQNTIGLQEGMFLDWQAVGSNGIRLIGITPPDALEQYRKNLARWRRAEQDNEG